MSDMNRDVQALKDDVATIVARHKASRDSNIAFGTAFGVVLGALVVPYTDGWGIGIIAVSALVYSYRRSP